MRALILRFVPIVKDLTVKTRTTYDDMAIELIELCVKSDEAWNWLRRLVKGDKVIFGLTADGNETPGTQTAYPNFVGCPCPKEVRDFLDKVAVEKEGYASAETADYGAGWGTILLAIQLIAAIRKFLQEINPSLDLDAA